MLIDLIKKHEGLRLKPYRCTAGKLTIGYGRNLEDVGISEEEAEILLRHDVEKVGSRLMENEWFRRLSEVRQAVLINMAFNLGYDGLMKFTKTLNLIKCGEYAEASEEMLNSRWAEQVGHRAQELSAMMKTG